jgi:two-component system LytT family response regulator
VTAPLRVLVVDDEPLARAGLARLAAQAPGCAIAGECADGLAAVAAIEELAPDVVLLDVQMPEMDGFGVLECARPRRPPHVIFVTAHEEHALRAFEVAALDYVLKPFEDGRLFAALARARERAPASWPLVVRMKGRRVLLRPDEIAWIEAAGYCARVHARGTAHALRESLDALERRLDPDRFRRVHRSAIVNLDHVAELGRAPSGAWRARLLDGTLVPISRRTDAESICRRAGRSTDPGIFLRS